VGGASAVGGLHRGRGGLVMAGGPKQMQAVGVSVRDRVWVAVGVRVKVNLTIQAGAWPRLVQAAAAGLCAQGRGAVPARAGGALQAAPRAAQSLRWWVQGHSGRGSLVAMVLPKPSFLRFKPSFVRFNLKPIIIILLDLTKQVGQHRMLRSAEAPPCAALRRCSPLDRCINPILFFISIPHRDLSCEPQKNDSS